MSNFAQHQSDFSVSSGSGVLAIGCSFVDILTSDKEKGRDNIKTAFQAFLQYPCCHLYMSMAINFWDVLHLGSRVQCTFWNSNMY